MNMNDDILPIMDSFNIWDGKVSSLRERTLLDVRDTDGKWFVGHVVSMDQRYVRVRYGGWDSSWDDWIALMPPSYQAPGEPTQTPTASSLLVKSSSQSSMAPSSPSSIISPSRALLSPIGTSSSDAKVPILSPSLVMSPSISSSLLSPVSTVGAPIMHRLRPLFSRSNRFGTRGRARERKQDAFRDVDGASSSLLPPSIPPLPITQSLSLDDDDIKRDGHDGNDGKRITTVNGITIELKVIAEDHHDDDDNDNDDDNDATTAVVISPRLRSIDGIYDRVAAERLALLMAFNNKAGRDSAVKHHFIHSPAFDKNLFPMIFSFLEQPPCIICKLNTDTPANPLLRPCECNQRLHKQCLQLTDDKRPPVCVTCQRTYAHRLRPPGCCDFTCTLPAQFRDLVVRWRWRLLALVYLIIACVLAAKPFDWVTTFVLICITQLVVICICLIYFFAPPAAPIGAMGPMESIIARIHMVVSDVSLMVALFARSDSYGDDDLWSLIVLFAGAQLICALATRHDPKAWGLFRMRLWYSGFVVLGCHSTFLGLGTYVVCQLLFWFGVYLYLNYYDWRTHATNANDFRLWLYCLCGGIMQNLEREEQNILIAMALARAQFLFSCFVITGAAVDLVRGDGNRRCAWTIIAAQAIMFTFFAFYMMHQRAILFMRVNAVPQLINWDPAAAGAAPVNNNGVGGAVVPIGGAPAPAAAAAAGPGNGNGGPVVIAINHVAAPINNGVPAPIQPITA